MDEILRAGAVEDAVSTICLQLLAQRAAELTAARAEIARLQAEVAAARAEITRAEAASTVVRDELWATRRALAVTSARAEITRLQAATKGQGKGSPQPFTGQGNRLGDE